MPISHRPCLLPVGGPISTKALDLDAPSTPPLPIADIERGLVEAKRGRCPMVWLVGGDPLAHPQLAQVLSVARRLGLPLGLITDGRLLVYEKLRALVRLSSIRVVRMPMHSADPAIHDELVRAPGAASQALRGAEALLSSAPRGTLRVELACTVLDRNIRTIKMLVDKAAMLDAVGDVTLRLVAPLQPRHWPMPTIAIQAIEQTMKRADAVGQSIVVEGFPHCWIPRGFHDKIDETLRITVQLLGPTHSPAVHLEDVSSRIKLPVSDSCDARTTCPGAPTSLLERWSEKAVSPTQRPKPNSFNFEFRDDLPRFSPSHENCPGLALQHPATSDRVLLLQRPDRIQRFVTPTADFTEEQIRRLKQDQRLYMDNASDATLTDYTDTIRAVRRHPTCETCPSKDECAQLWVQRPGRPFEAQEAWLRQKVEQLSGMVLDVGCGEQPYEETIRRLIRENVITYHGLDPDMDAIEHTRSLSPAGSYHVSNIESFSWDGTPFDHVLVLRSINHFLDVDAAFANITRITHPGSHVVLCDAPVFALLRTRTQVKHADEHAAVGHEHYRNWTSHETIERLQEFPFRVTFHQPVLPSTGGEWLLELVRVAEAETPPKRSSPRSP